MEDIWNMGGTLMRVKREEKTNEDVSPVIGG